MSNTNNPLTWNSPLEALFKGRVPKTAEKLSNQGIKTIKDLIWIFPLRVQTSPVIKKFSHAVVGQLFKGQGRVISCQITPAFKGRGQVAYGKGRVPLFRCKLIVESYDDKDHLTLTWFNVYPNLKKKIEAMEDIEFLGVVSEFQGRKQIANPKISEPSHEDNHTAEDHHNLLREYPTVAGVAARFTKQYIDKIPSQLWNSIPEKLPIPLIEKRQLTSIKKSFAIIHGLVYKDDWTPKLFEVAKKRLIYEEFFQEQMKIISRRQAGQKKQGPYIPHTKKDFHYFSSLFPYELTEDQKTSLEATLEDFSSSSPMMRMIQGDVGSGKTTIAFMAMAIAAKAGWQVAIMCPTEALALQHFQTAKEILGQDFHIESLLGAHKEKEKKEIIQRLESGLIQIIIGTHSLFQDKVHFKNLGFIVIDEQHKFGVEQRLKLARKGNNPHSMIMTATPIPRSLSLTQYGDLDISIIKSIPHGRKGTQTRIVHPQLINKYLSFVKTRLELKEQAYIVAPAIEESEVLDIQNVTKIYEQYQNYFPQNRISLLHGKLKAEEKEEIFHNFLNKKIDILISTSVIEVGINNTNATVIAIYNPERFGLSSLHQLRGRVGRGEKPGFCFLVCDEKISKTSLERIEIIEQTHDGFKIAEKDLEQRGQGDLFGKNQSGSEGGKRLANIAVHGSILQKVIEDIHFLKTSHHEIYLDCVHKYNDDESVHNTI